MAAVSLNSGQAVLEYVLLLLFVVGFVQIIGAFMPDLLEKLERPIRVGLVRAYKNGHPLACGPDDPAPCEGVKKHPRYGDGTSKKNYMFARGRTR